MDCNYILRIALTLLSNTLTVSSNEIKDESSSSSTYFRVNQGDVVRLIAPGGRGASELPPIISYVQSLGLTHNMTENIYQDEPLGYANTDEFRLNDLISSAITVLHLYLQQKYGWQTIHGTNLDYVGIGFYDGSDEGRASLAAHSDLIFNRQESICLPSLTRIDERPAVDQIESRIVGGNLELVETSLATFWQVDTHLRILFLEDAGRAAWRIEMSLDHLKLAGVLDHAQAVVFGDFTGADNDTLVDIAFRRFSQDVWVPVFKLTGIGHGNVNYPLPLLATARITRSGSNDYQLCVDNISGEIVNSNSSGSIGKAVNQFTFLLCTFVGMIGLFTFHEIK